MLHLYDLLVEDVQEVVVHAKDDQTQLGMAIHQFHNGRNVGGQFRFIENEHVGFSAAISIHIKGPVEVHSGYFVCRLICYEADDRIGQQIITLENQNMFLWVQAATFIYCEWLIVLDKITRRHADRITAATVGRKSAVSTN